MALRILYIEDHEDNMTLVRRILNSRNFELVEARNGADGLSLAESHDLHLILLDINLPDIDGYEVARQLRASPKPSLANIPIIALTANALDGDENKAIKAGCSAYLSKPLDMQKLLDTIDKFSNY